MESRAYSLLVVLRFLLAVAAFVVEHGLWGMQDSVVGLVGSRAQAQQLWHTGLVAPQHVGSSQTRDRTHVCCIDRQILYHWATREALFFSIYVPTILIYTYPQVVLDSILFLEVKFFFLYLQIALIFKLSFEINTSNHLIVLIALRQSVWLGLWGVVRDAVAIEEPLITVAFLERLLWKWNWVRWHYW